jgi:hypothetical protein
MLVINLLPLQFGALGYSDGYQLLASLQREA